MSRVIFRNIGPSKRTWSAVLSSTDDASLLSVLKASRALRSQDLCLAWNSPDHATVLAGFRPVGHILLKPLNP